MPRLLAMLCILAVFMPAFFMIGAAQALFVPLSLAVGFSMIASYLLSSTLVPILSVWLLRGTRARGRHAARPTARFARFQTRYARGVADASCAARWLAGRRLSSLAARS